MKRKEYKHSCHYCKERHWCCSYEYSENCNHWKMGRCLKCIYQKNGEDHDEAETDAWYKRGCETFFPDAKRYCKKFIPYNRFTLFLYNKGIIKL